MQKVYEIQTRLAGLQHYLLYYKFFLASILKIVIVITILFANFQGLNETLLHTANIKLKNCLLLLLVIGLANASLDFELKSAHGII